MTEGLVPPPQVSAPELVPPHFLYHDLHVRLICNATAHRIFDIDGDDEELNVSVGSFGLWIVGKVGMFTRRQGDPMWKHYQMCQQQPILIFEGDFKQLPPGISGEDDMRHCMWWCHTHPMYQFVLRHALFRFSGDEELLQICVNTLGGEEVATLDADATWSHMELLRELGDAPPEKRRRVLHVAVELVPGRSLGSMFV